MVFKSLGRTGIQVSTIGFGASPLGNVYGQLDEVTACRAVTSAIERGINVFDVSPYYGLTVAEEHLGRALVGNRAHVVLATKCGRYGAERFDFSAATITRELENSLRRLRTEFVDVLQAHDVEFGEERQIVEETVPAMERLREQGKVRAIGLTGYWPGQLARLAEQTGVDCVLNYCHGNLFADGMLTELAPVAARTGLGLLNASPLHMGLLGNRQLPAWHPAPEALRTAGGQVRELCRRFSVDPGTLALRFCLDLAPVSSTFVGLGSEAEVEAACDALHWTAPVELIAEVNAVIGPVHNLTWPSGLKRNQDLKLAQVGRA